MADHNFSNNQSKGKMSFKLDTRMLLFVTIGLLVVNILISFSLISLYKNLVKPVLPLDVQVKQALQQQKDLYKLTEKIKKISNGKAVDEE